MWMTLVLAYSVHAGELKVQNASGAAFRRLFAVCDSTSEKCFGGKCKLALTELRCERVPDSMKASCTFKCNGNEHMLTGDQALSVFKAVESHKKMIEKTESTETFKDASVACEALKSETSGLCKIKHSKIK
ncbi:MAG: hypothetical protein KF799_05505 [Bdellovibrionales bacterium]|nr:hypothetical protein [Bdellovibrionales bacterium]